MHTPPPSSTLFPYTTLFRSTPRRGSAGSYRSAWLRRRLRDRLAYDCPEDAILYRERNRSEEHTSELQSHSDLVCRLLLEKKNHDRSYPKFHIRQTGACEMRW